MQSEEATNQRASDNQRETKRRRVQQQPQQDPPKTDNNEPNGDSSVTVDYQWLDRGVIDVTTGRNCHQGIQLTVDGETVTVRCGDAVRLNSDEDEEQEEGGEGEEHQTIWICKVLEMWDAPDGEAVYFTGQWLFGKIEIAQYQGSPWDGCLTRDELLKRMRTNELVESDRTDENEIGSILSLETIVYQSPEDDSPDEIPSGSFLCRYRLDTSQPKWSLYACASVPKETQTQEQDTGMEEATEANDTMEENEDEDDDEEGAGDDEDDQADDSSTNSSGQSSASSDDQVRIEGEGSNFRSDIQIGPKYQVVVEAFEPGNKYVPSRTPQLVWKANSISDADLHSFLSQLAPIHQEYLEKHGLTTVSGTPYCPLPTCKAEELMRANNNQLIYPSHMSSGAALCTQRNALLKECNVDAVMEILCQHDYNVDEALDAVKKDLAKISVGWTRTEKIIFNEGFRQEQGAIRSIAKLLHPMKSYTDVVDYWYRCKMVDQFRYYQEKKREQAIRMVECIEKRRYHEFTLNAVPRMETLESQQSQVTHWSQTSVVGAVSAVEDRRQAAKFLLMDTTKTVGNKVAAEIAAVLRELHSSYDAKLKKHLFSLLVGHPELQQRFLEFLPKN